MVIGAFEADLLEELLNLLEELLNLLEELLTLLDEEFHLLVRGRLYLEERLCLAFPFLQEVCCLHVLL